MQHKSTFKCQFYTILAVDKELNTFITFFVSNYEIILFTFSSTSLPWF